MKNTPNGEKAKEAAIVQFLKILFAMALLVALAVTVFLNFYTHYNDGILYAERLDQMKDVTSQLFSGLEDVVGNQWNTADVLCNYMEVAAPADVETLQRFMQKQAALNKFNGEVDTLLAVDSSGRYYTQNGMGGTLQELDYLLDDPARVSFVSNTVTTNRTKIVFLNRLEQSIPMQVGEQRVELIYYGFTRDMNELEPYFDCAAYAGSSGVYVVDRDGLKLFSSSSSSSTDGALVKGYNVYNVLETMQYLHGSDFDSAKAEMNTAGTAYSNAILDGREYYYALYRMDSAEWTLVFLVKSDAVARNTVALVNTTVNIVMVFAVGMAVACALAIFLLLRSQQKKELALAEQANDTAATADGSALSGMKFLCAEDNALNAEILQALLEMSGASCKICGDGAELVHEFEGVQPGDYDAILMDVQMPVMNGIDATRAIRSSANELGRTIPIIAMTANAFSEDVQHCLEAGMDAHMAKPISMEVLEKTVKKFRVGGKKRYTVPPV